MLLGMTLASAFAASTPVAAPAQPAQVQPVQVPQGAIVLDGALNEAAWRQAPVLKLTQQNPHPGQPTPYVPRCAYSRCTHCSARPKPCTTVGWLSTGRDGKQFTSPPRCWWVLRCWECCASGSGWAGLCWGVWSPVPRASRCAWPENRRTAFTRAGVGDGCPGNADGCASTAHGCARGYAVRGRPSRNRACVGGAHRARGDACA